MYGKYKQNNKTSKIQNVKKEAQLSPMDPRDALYQLNYCYTVVQITTATFYSAVSAWT